MPLLDENTRLCLMCGHEYTIQDHEWLVTDDDPSVFQSPPCPECESVEVFCWHNDLFYKEVYDEVELLPQEGDMPAQKIRVQWLEPDPESVGAEHMMINEAIGNRLGLEQKAVPNRPLGFSYSKQPKKPSKATQRERFKDSHKINRKLPGTSKDQVQESIQVAKARAKKDREEFVNQKQERAQVKEKQRELEEAQKPKPPLPHLIPEDVKERLSKPEVDEEQLYADLTPGEEVTPGKIKKRKLGGID